MRRGLSTAELLAWLVAAATLPAPSALAAPFCLVTQNVPPQCIYFDPNDCRREADHQRGLCEVNPQEVALTPGIGTYCVVTASQVSLCEYQDYTTCVRAATREGGICAAAPVPTIGNAPPSPPPPRPAQGDQGALEPLP